MNLKVTTGMFLAVCICILLLSVESQHSAGCQPSGKARTVGLYTCFQNGVCNGAELPYLPPLPEGTKKLLLVWEDKTCFLSDNFFTNVTRVMELCFKGEYQVTISPKTFLPLAKLKALYFETEELDISSTLSSVYAVKTLRKLGLRVIDGGGQLVSRDVFLRFPMPKLKELSLAGFGTSSGMLDLGIFSPLKNLRMFNFTNGVISNICNTSALPSLERMSLSGNNFTVVSIAQFSRLKKLSALDLSFNSISAVTATNVSLSETSPCLDKPTTENNFNTVRLSKLLLLDISHNSLSHMTHTESFPNLEKLDLSFNLFDAANFTEISPLKQLKRIDLSHNKITGDWISHLPMPSVEAVNLRSNKISGLPETCQQSESLYPKLRIIDLTDKMLIIKVGAICLPKLTTLLLGTNEFEEMRFSFFNEEQFPDFTTFDLSNQRGLCCLYNMGQETALQSIDLSFNNRLLFNHEYSVRVRTFAGCVKLKRLFLGHTNFDGVGPKRFKQLFGDLTKLQQLSLRSTGLVRITASMFSTMTSLQILDLSGNKLFQLPENMLLQSPFLTSLNASYNQISTLPESAFPLYIRLRLQHVDLSANPFLCSCDLLWFRGWLVENFALFEESVARYTCDNLPGTTVQSFFIQEQTCLLSEASLVAMIVTVVLLILVMITITLTYHYRWHIRLKLYNAFRNQRDRQQRLEGQNFRYDVFVSFDSQDEKWVREHLIPELEGRMGLRLCLHFRDFIPGKPVVENIDECILSSKKMMMIFSKNFAASNWCQFELQVCLTHAMDNEDALLVVLLHEIPSRDLTYSMKAVMQTTTYVEWPEDSDARATFWARVRTGLHEILPEV